MKKVLYTDFENMDEIISKMLLSKELKRAVTRNNLYKFWKKSVGSKFCENSKPYGMSGNNVMIIACKSSVVAQELLLHKTQILTKLEPYLKSLKLTVKDLRFDPKKWVDDTQD